MKIVCNEVRDEERAYYGSRNIEFRKITIKGPADGESSFKESKNIVIKNSKFFLRYPLWHNTNTLVDNCSFSKTSRAPFWYDKNILFNKVNCKGVKAVRECQNVEVVKSTFDSIEFGWQCKTITVKDSSIIGNYAFLHSSNVSLDSVSFKGKYSFQYVNKLRIKNSILETKDAFWHAKDAIVENSTIIGEYLGWYAENIKFINCKIKGTQPLCYAKGIVFENCEFENCDLAFEYSEVNGTIDGTLVSIKNPLKGHLLIDQIPNMIVDNNNRSKGEFLIEKR